MLCTLLLPPTELWNVEAVVEFVLAQWFLKEFLGELDLYWQTIDNWILINSCLPTFCDTDA